MKNKQITKMKITKFENFDEWEGKTTKVICEKLDITYSDASGIFDANPFITSQEWTKGNTPEQCAQKIIGIGNEQEEKQEPAKFCNSFEFPGAKVITIEPEQFE